MYVFLVVFHGAELKMNVLTPETALFFIFSRYIALEAFLALNQGGGGMLDLVEFFQKKIFFKNFSPKFIFIRC